MNDYLLYIKKIISRISSLIIADAISLFLMALFSILFGRIYGKEFFGIFSLSFILLIIFRTFIDLGFDYSIPRSISSSPERALREIIESQKVKLYILIIFLPLAIIISFFSTLSINFIILYLSLLPNTLSSSAKATLRGFSDMKTIAKIETVLNLVFYPIAGTAVLLKFNIAFIFLLFLILEFVRAFWYFNVIKVKLNHKFNFIKFLFIPFSSKSRDLNINIENNTSFFKIISGQMKLLAINLLSVLHFRLSSLLLGILSNTIAVGEFSAGLRFLTVLRVIPGAILNTLLPDFSKNNNEKKWSKLYLILFLFIFGLIISFLLWLFAEPLMMFTFGFESSIPVLKILAWGFVIAVLSFSFEAFLISKKKEKYVNFSLLIALIATLIASIFYIPKYAAIGAAISAIIAESVLLMSYIIFIAYEKILILKKLKIQN